jgi:hypothetical protein
VVLLDQHAACTASATLHGDDTVARDRPRFRDAPTVADPAGPEAWLRRTGVRRAGVRRWDGPARRSGFRLTRRFRTLPG